MVAFRFAFSNLAVAREGGAGASGLSVAVVVVVVAVVRGDSASAAAEIKGLETLLSRLRLSCASVKVEGCEPRDSCLSRPVWDCDPDRAVVVATAGVGVELAVGSGVAGWDLCLEASDCCARLSFRLGLVAAVVQARLGSSKGLIELGELVDEGVSTWSTFGLSLRFVSRDVRPFFPSRSRVLLKLPFFDLGASCNLNAALVPLPFPF